MRHTDIRTTMNIYGDMVTDEMSTAGLFWPDGDPTGERFRYGVPGESPSAWRTVVGVVGDTLPNGPESSSLPQFYLPLAQSPEAESMDIIVRGEQDQLPLTKDIRSAIVSVSPINPKFEVSTVESQLDRLGSRRRFQTWLLTAFSAIAFVLAGIGTYGLISYSVTERIHEIGIRMALGASRTDVLRMVLSQAIRIAGVGLLVGTGGALVFSRAASNLLFGVSWADTLTLSFTAGLLLFAALIAAYIPARRATKANPIGLSVLHYRPCRTLRVATFTGTSSVASRRMTSNRPRPSGLTDVMHQ